MNGADRMERITKNPINKLLGCKYPIIMGAMQWITRAEFVASVADRGGFAFLTSSPFKSADELRDEIKKTKALTDKAFGVNISVLPETEMNDLLDGFADVISGEKLVAIETAGQIPKEFTEKIKGDGIRILHKVTSPRHAASAQKSGVDAVIAIGYEAAGHPGMGQVGSFVNLPAIVESVDLPVVAGGGVVDGKGLVAALSFGAAGVLMGTRFLATKEAPIHDAIKQWMLNATEQDTLIVQRSIRNAMRCMKNDHALKVLGVEEMNTSFKQLYPYITGQLCKEAYKTGRVDDAIIAMGQGVGLINNLPTVGELMDSVIGEAREIVSKLSAFPL
jgi:nitronate monooxygenase